MPLVLAALTAGWGRQAIAQRQSQRFVMCHVTDTRPKAGEAPRRACLMEWGVREGFREEVTVELGLEW